MNLYRLVYVLYTVHTYYMHWVLRTHNVRVCLYIVYIACGSISLYIKTLYFFICTFFMLAAATVANIKICYDAKTPKFDIFGTRVICVFYSISILLWIYPLPKTSPYWTFPSIEHWISHKLNIPTNWTPQYMNPRSNNLKPPIHWTFQHTEYLHSLITSTHWISQYFERFV